MERLREVVTEKTELQDGCTKVPDWTAEVLEVEKFAERINDPNRAALSAVPQVENGDAWLELRSRVAGAEIDGKPPPRVAAVMPWTGDEQEASNIRHMTGGELQKSAGAVPYMEIGYKRVWVTAMQRSLGPQFRAARFQTEAPNIFPTTVVSLKVDKKFVNEQTWTAIVQRPAKWPKNGYLRHLSFEFMRCVHDLGWAERSFNGGGQAFGAD